MCGGEHSFAAQISLQIDADIVKNSRFRTETNYLPLVKTTSILLQTAPCHRPVGGFQAPPETPDPEPGEWTTIFLPASYQE